jgi:hypothetical protein
MIGTILRTIYYQVVGWYIGVYVLLLNIHDGYNYNYICCMVNQIYLFQVLAWQASIDTQGIIDLTRITDVTSAIHSLFNHLEKTLGKQKVTKNSIPHYFLVLYCLHCCRAFGLK